MYVCICREIKDSDFENEEDLLNRLKENDICCGKCLKEFVDADKIGRLGRGFDTPISTKSIVSVGIESAIGLWLNLAVLLMGMTGFDRG